MPSTLHSSALSLRSHPELPLNAQRTTRRPLVGLRAAVELLDLETTDEVLARIEDGRIGWAWDIGMRNAECGVRNEGRREVRVFRSCLISDSHPLTADAVYNAIVPSHWGTIKAVSLRKRWQCSEQLITELIASGELVAITGASRGSDGSPELTRESVIKFLKSRRIGAANSNHGNNGTHEI